MLVLRPGISYENGGSVALCVKGAVATVKDGIIPLLEVEAFKTMVARTSDNVLGGGTPLVVTVVKEISVFHEEVAVCASIVAGDTNGCS